MNYNKLKNIVSSCESFIEKELEVNGHKVSIFSYLLASYKDFKEHDAFELRGLTYVHDSDEIWYSCPKFFNVNETEEFSQEVLKKDTLVKVYDKLDGSLVQPIKFPDGSIIWKSKSSFTSAQAVSANKLGKEIEDQVKEMIKDGYVPIFEYTAPENQIVVGYDKPALTLIMVRDFSGNFYNVEKLGLKYGLPFPESFDYSLDELLALKKTEKDIEGWILLFENAGLVKLKTDWYLNLHGTVSNVYSNVHTIANLVLDEKLDDVLTNLNEGSTKNFVYEIQNKVDSKFNEMYSKVFSVLKEAKNSGITKKEFALQYNKKPWFTIAAKCFNSDDLEDCVKDSLKVFFKKQCTKLNKAVEFLELNREL